MAEEHGFQSPEGHRLCVNNCGFFGSPATQNMCSKCFRDLGLHKSGESSMFSASLTPPPQESGDSSLFSTSLTPPPQAVAQPSVNLISSPEKAEISAAVVVVNPSPSLSLSLSPSPSPQQAATNRCSTCRKKVGLTGFRCRCGVTFCGTHRYPEKHGCTFDFKAMGREAIAKANPLVKAEKLEKI